MWTNVGYVTLFFLAGILAIPGDIHDAARTDGANAWQRFGASPADAAADAVLRLGHWGVSAAQVFDTVYALTGGGRRTAPT